MATAASAVARAQNRAIAKGTDPKAATCRAKLQRARSALNRQMDRELRLREGAENLLRATAKGDGGDGGVMSGVGRTKSKSRKLIRQTVALELSFLESNVRVLADELAELNGSVDAYQYRDDEDEDDEAAAECGVDGYLDGFGNGSVASGADHAAAAGRRRRPRQMPMIAVPLKDTRPIDFGPPLERFIGQHYGVDLSAILDEPESNVGDNDSHSVRRKALSLREAIDELTQLRMDTQTPSRDADGVRLLLRYYRQLYYVDRRFFPPSSIAPSTYTQAPRPLHHNHHQQQSDHQHRHSKHAVVTADVSSPPPAIYFEWYDSFGGPVPSCGQRTVRFEQACVLFNVAAVHTQMGAKHDRRCCARDDGGSGGSSRSAVDSPPPPSVAANGDGQEPTADGAAAATRCFLRAAGAYRHIGETFANAPARAADLRATGVLYALMMAQAHECVFEKLHWKVLGSMRHRCRGHRGDDVAAKDGRRRSTQSSEAAATAAGDRNGQDVKSRRTSASAAGATNDYGNGRGATPSWSELAREAAHVSRMYAEVVYNSSCCRPCNDGAAAVASSGKENERPPSVLPEVWTSVCRIKDRHYAALAYRYAACALLPYFRRPAADDDHRRRCRHRGADEAEADELLAELTAAAAAAGLDVAGDDDYGSGGGDAAASSAVARQQRRCKQIGKLLLEAAAAAHDRAARAQRLCRQLRTRADGHSSGDSGGGGGGGGRLLAGVLDRERRRTRRILLLHRRRRRDGNEEDVDDDYDDDSNDSAYDTIGDGASADDADDGRRCCCCADGGIARKMVDRLDYHECCSDDEGGAEVAAIGDHCSGGGSAERIDDFAGVPGLDVDHGVLVRPRTRFRLSAIAPDFTDTGDGDDEPTVAGDSRRDDDFGHLQNGDGAAGDRRRECRRTSREAPSDREERRADLFAGLGPVAVFSARHRCTRPRWFKVIRGGRHRSSAASDGDDDETSTDPMQLVDRWFGFELRSHGGGGAAGAVPPATVGHVRSNSPAQLAGLRRGDIVVALKRAGGRVSDVRWETCRRVAELLVHDYVQRRRHPNSAAADGSVAAVQLKIVTPITATSDAHCAPAPIDSNKMLQYSRSRRIPAGVTSPLPLQPAPALMMSPSSASKQQQQKRQRRPNASGGSNDTAAVGGSSKINTWLWNPFRRRRRTAVGNKC